MSHFKLIAELSLNKSRKYDFVSLYLLLHTVQKYPGYPQSFTACKKSMFCQNKCRGIVQVSEG